MKKDAESKNHIGPATLIFLLCWTTSLALVFISVLNSASGIMSEVILGLSLINLAGLESLENYWDNLNYRTNSEKWYRTRLKMIATIILLAIVSVYMYVINYDRLVVIVLLLFTVVYLGIYLFKEIKYRNEQQ